MTGRPLIRGSAVAALALALAAGSLPGLLAAAQAAETGTGLALPAPDRYAPVQDTVFFAGDSGYLHRRPTADGSPGPYQWRGYDGSEKPVEGFTGTLPTQYGYYGAGTDVLPVASGSSGQVQLRDMATEESSTLTVPDGQSAIASFSTTVLSVSYDEYWRIDQLHVLRVRDGVTQDLPVTAPDGEAFTEQPVLAGDGRTALIRFRHAYHIGILDLETGAVTTIPTNVAVDDSLKLQAALSPTHVAWYQPGMSGARVVSRGDATGAQTTVAVPRIDSGEATPYVGLAGEWLLTTYRGASGTGGPLLATPLDGGQARTLLTSAQPDLAQIPGGGAVAAGGTTSGDWAVRRVEAAPDGSLALRTLAAVPAQAAQVRGVALAGGLLATKEEDSAAVPSYQVRNVTLGATPAAGQRSYLTEAPRGDVYGQPVGAGDGSVLHLRYDDVAQRDVLVRASGPGDRTEMVPLDQNMAQNTGWRLRDAAGRYAVWGGGSYRWVVDLAAAGGAKTVLSVSQSAVAVWGTKVWTTDGSGGRIESRDLVSGVVSTYAVGADCRIQDMQAAGRWVYWDCAAPDSTGTSALPFGVYDQATGKNIALPQRGKLGDGFVVTHDKGAGKLLLSDFHTGTAAQPRTLADLSVVPGWKNFDVDKFGGGIAWVDGAGATHVEPSGVPTQPLTGMAARTDAAVGLASGDTTWNGSWQLSKPAADGATVLIKRKGRVIRTLDAPTAGAALSAAWDGRLPDGSTAPPGTYTWELNATPKDGQGAALALSGTLTAG
ncbi:FlgD immunoglobulin-like domain containing protein [Streptomyces sp. NPDC052236]|uniref:FlgD immunoglobulin-like domain containing protein n=1 Tax=Streptomyces sp. NPDC052236 TaxID=3365686 RepID=UPI0037D8302B